MSHLKLYRHFLLLFILSSCMSNMNDGHVVNADSKDMSVKTAFPNPMLNLQECNRTRPSFICNPDSVLTHGEADRLDLLSFNLRRSTLCVCSSSCSSRNLGASFGVYIIKNFPESSKNLTKVAEHLRSDWKLGTCQDDIIIAVEAETKQAAFSMGSAVETIITRSIGEKIFNECAIHFENSNFYQGLESMVNSYHDILRRLQRPRVKPNRSNLSLILGIILAVIALILFVGAVIIAVKHRRLTRRSSSKKRRSQQNKSNSNNNETSFVKKSRNFQYKLCNVDDSPKSQGDIPEECSEKVSYPNDKNYDPSSMLNVPQVRTMRQLSDVAEETEDESDSSSLTKRTSALNELKKIQITEL